MSASALEHDRADMQEFSPAGLKVLVVDDDKLCLKVIGKMLQQCHYEVSTCCSSAEALALLRNDESDFDLVLSDVVMPDMDGFKLLELIGLEMDVPVISAVPATMMSYDGDTNTVLKGVTHGAVDFLTKPVRQEELSNMWQHVVRRRRTKATSPSPEGTEKHGVAGPSNSSGQEQAAPDEFAAAQGCKLGKRGPEDRADSGGGNVGAAQQGGTAAAGTTGAGSKRPRVHWTSEMHSQFVSAVNQLGIDKAVPKKILELMTVKGLTRENVASHLQKYRLYLKKAAKMDGPQQNQQAPVTALPQQQQQHQPPQQQQQQHMGSGMLPPVTGVQPEGQFSQTYMGQPAGMVVPGVQSMQPVFDQQGFAQAPWQQPMMVTGTPPVYHPQGAWQPMMGQPMMGQPQMEPSTSQAVAGVPFGVAAGVPRPTQAHNTNSMSTLPPLAGDRMDSSLSMSPLVDNLMIGEGNADGGGARIKRSSADTLGFSGMSASYMDDSGLDGPIPEDMEEFLSILTKDAPQEA